MKISKLFHYLYACIMFLPLLVIPIFAINIINRSPEPISVTVDDTETTLDILYKYQSNEVNSLDDLVSGNIYELDYLTINNTQVYDFDLNIIKFSDSTYELFGLGFDSFNLNDLSNDVYFNLYGDTFDLYWSVTNGNNTYFDFWNDFSFSGSFITFESVVFSMSDPELNYDLIEFNYSLYNSLPRYTDYNVIESAEVITTGTTTTYNDTDIGSQFVYSVYSVTDKYFNVTDLFGFDALQQWFIVNIFDGSVNLGFYIFWNLLTYWLFASIFWLVFDVAIYVPQLVHRWLDKGVIE